MRPTAELGRSFGTKFDEAKRCSKIVLYSDINALLLLKVLINTSVMITVND